MLDTIDYHYSIIYIECFGWRGGFHVQNTVVLSLETGGKLVLKLCSVEFYSMWPANKKVWPTL